jgi:hypothetical protein
MRVTSRSIRSMSLAVKMGAGPSRRRQIGGNPRAVHLVALKERGARNPHDSRHLIRVQDGATMWVAIHLTHR